MGLDELWFVRPYDFLSKLNSQVAEILFGIGKQLDVKKNQLIFNAGASSDYVYVLIEGRTKIFELTSEGKEVILWFCFPGELFGIAEVIQGSNRAVHAHACSKVKVLKIKRQLFMRFLKDYPEISLHVIELLACRLRELGDVMSNLVSDEVASRVVKLLTRLCARYGEGDGDELRLNISLTHQEMADMIGATRQTVTTVLSMLKKRGHLRIENKTIYIKNHEWVNNIVDRQHPNKYFLRLIY